MDITPILIRYFKPLRVAFIWLKDNPKKQFKFQTKGIFYFWGIIWNLVWEHTWLGIKCQWRAKYSCRFFKLSLFFCVSWALSFLWRQLRNVNHSFFTFTIIMNSKSWMCAWQYIVFIHLTQISDFNCFQINYSEQETITLSITDLWFQAQKVNFNQLNNMASKFH